MRDPRRAHLISIFEAERRAVRNAGRRRWTDETARRAGDRSIVSADGVVCISVQVINGHEAGRRGAERLRDRAADLRLRSRHVPEAHLIDRTGGRELIVRVAEDANLRRAHAHRARFDMRSDFFAVDEVPVRRAIPRDGDVRPRIGRNFSGVIQRARSAEIRAQRRSANTDPPRLRPVPSGDARASTVVVSGHPRFEGKAIREVECRAG